MKNCVSNTGSFATAWKSCLLCLATGLVATQAHALSIQKAVAQEFDDRTELTLTLDEPLSSNVSAFRVTSPNRQILDFPVLLSNTSLPFTPSVDGRITKADLINGQGRTRLVLQMAGSYDVEKAESPQSIKLVVRGPAP